MSIIAQDEMEARYWLIARRRRALLDELETLDAEMAQLNAVDEAEET